MGFAQDYHQKITGHYRDANLGYIINDLQKRYKLDFTYSNALNLGQIMVSQYHFTNKPITEVLGDLLYAEGLTFRESSGALIILKKEKPGKLFGRVTDSKGNPLAGANVQLLGSNQKTKTNKDGTYLLQAEAGKHTLLVSYLSHDNRRFEVEVQSERDHRYDVQLNQNEDSIEEVVVTALGLKRQERKLGYSVTQVKGEDVSTNKTINIQSALIGKVAGLDISEPANGIAGSKKVNLRGISSISPTGSTSPLWIVDGVPVNSSSFGSNNDAGGGIDYGDGLSAINPDNVESISVLKGNAAAALYGSRASNGVIIVTTKGGKSAKQGYKIDFNSSFVNNHIRDLSDWQYEYGQGRDKTRPITQQEALETGAYSWGERLDNTPTIQFDGQLRPYTAQKHNVREFYSSAPSLQNTVSLSKSADNHHFRFSVGHMDSKDYVSSGKYAKRNAQLNATTTAGKFTVQLNSMYSVENVKNRQYIGGNVRNAHYTLTNIPTNINVLDLKPGFLENGEELIFTNGSITNPYFVIDKLFEKDSRHRWINMASVKYDYAEGIYSQVKVMQDYYFFKRMNYQPMGMNWQPFDGEISQRWTDFQEMNYEFTTGYNKAFTTDFSFSGLLGANMRKPTSQSVNMYGTPFVVPDVYTLNNTINKTTTTSTNESQINSLFGMMELGWRNYMFLTLTGRQDWFSTLPKENNNLFYPAGSLSFVFTDAFKLPKQVISHGKLRASIAQVSGGADPYSLDLSYGLDSKNYEGQVLQGIATTTIPNKKLKPLISTEYELGLEATFAHGLIHTDIAYYNKRIKDDIVSINVSNASGFNKAIMNTGKISNSGIEVLLTVNPFMNQDFQWTITGTYSKNYNKIISLGDVNSIQIGAAKNDVVTVNIDKDEPYGIIKGSVYKRDDTGNIVYDTDGYPMVGDRSTKLGKGYHDQIAGLANKFSYRGIVLNILLDAKFGGKLYSQTNRWAVSAGKHKMTLTGREDGLIGQGAKEDGSPNDIFVDPSSIASYYNRITTIHENFIYDAGYIKLRELSLGYNLPSRWIERTPIKSLGASFVGRNLFYLRNNIDNVSPESSISSSNVQGLENSGYPETRYFGVNLNMSF